MNRILAIAAVAAVLIVSGCTTAKMMPARPDDSELQRLESAKWDPSSLGGKEAFMDLFAEDFVSVEYGPDVHGGVHRKTRADVFSAPPLPPARFELSEWKFIHAAADAVVVSYRVKGLSFPWEAYATSMWARRGGKWRTVFYQASTAN